MNGARLLVGLVLVGCAPSFDEHPYQIADARLIAVIAEPAEVRPGDTVTLSPVVAGRGTGELSFRFCTAQLPLTDPRPASERCFDDPGIALTPHGNAARGSVPTDACARFGPDPAGAKLRPSDADATGGFYQPVVVEGLGTVSLALLRIHCPLPDAPADLSNELARRYELNQNPEFGALQQMLSCSPADVALHAGAPNELIINWSEASRESYVWLAPGAGALETRHEQLRVSWFVSNGSLASSATGGSETDRATFSSNTFAPDPGVDSAELWLVLQDSRGGNAAKHWRFSVAP